MAAPAPDPELPPLAGLRLALERLPASLPIWHGTVDSAQWSAAAQAVAAWTASRKWTDDDGKWIQGAHIWMKQRQWENIPERAPARRVGNPNEIQETLEIPIINLDD